MENADPLLTVQECAEILKVSKVTFYRRIADGTVPRPMKVGSLSRWAKSDILAVIAAAKAARGKINAVAAV